MKRSEVCLHSSYGSVLIWNYSKRIQIFSCEGSVVEVPGGQLIVVVHYSMAPDQLWTQLHSRQISISQQFCLDNENGDNTKIRGQILDAESEKREAWSQRRCSCAEKQARTLSRSTLPAQSSDGLFVIHVYVVETTLLTRSWIHLHWKTSLYVTQTYFHHEYFQIHCHKLPNPLRDTTQSVTERATLPFGGKLLVHPV